MPEKLTQKNRPMSISTPLGEDALLLVGMHGAEALGRLFEFELDLMGEGAVIDPGDILGQNVTVEIQSVDGKDTRHFNGHISRFVLISASKSASGGDTVFTYRATLVPWLWFHTLFADCQIFQNMTVPDIIKAVCKGKGHTEIEERLTGNYRTWEYCVQYRETDFNFLSRLMENEGIYYYFKHDQNKHTLVLCDSGAAHDAMGGGGALAYRGQMNQRERETSIWAWTRGYELVSNQYVITDYNPLTPQTDLKQNAHAAPSLNIPSKTTFEVFDFPGGQTASQDGRAYVLARMNELESQYAIIHGASGSRMVQAGATFSLAEHPTDEAEYLITAVSYQLQGERMGMALRAKSVQEDFYECQITCVPKKVEFRSPRTTPKPVVQGPQTARVTGPKGEEIYCDKYGRVKCQFYWDRKGTLDENSSCWMRVSQMYAGKNWGAMDLPRIGQEVIVEFLEGDPDRPIITGRVYNGTNMPPYTLPDKKMVSGMKSNSTPGGGGYNEFSMDDTKGKEKVTIHGQFDMATTIEHDQTDVVHNNRTATVDVDDSESIGGKQTISVKGKQSITVGGDQAQSISGKQDEQIGGDQSLTVSGKQNYTIGSDQTHSIGGKQSLTVGGDSSSTISGKESATIGGDLSIVTGGEVKITAASKITLMAGPSTIELGPDGITITAGGMVKVFGAMIKHNG